MDEMDMCLMAADEPMGEDGLKRSSATCGRIVPKDGKSPGYSADQALGRSLRIAQQGRGALAAMHGPAPFPSLTTRHMPSLPLPRHLPCLPALRAVDLRRTALDQ